MGFKDGIIANDLSYSIAHELRMPLLKIARLSELQQSSRQPSLEAIEVIADSVLKLLDSYLITTRYTNEQIQLELEPVSLSAVMYDVAQYLDRLSRAQNCEIRLKVQKNSGLVLAHHQGIKAAFLSLCYAFLHSTDHTKKAIISLEAHRTQNKVVAGVLCNDLHIEKSAFNKGQQLYGRAYQSIKDIPTNGAGYFIAANLFETMTVPLQFIHSTRRFGVMGTFHSSSQLNLL